MGLKIGYSYKKALALSFLLLANAVMMGHAVIPHHHHNGVVFTLKIAHNEHDCNSHSDRHDCNSHPVNDDAQSDGKCEYPFCHDDVEKCSLMSFYVHANGDKQFFQLEYPGLNLFPFVLSPLSDDFISTDLIGLPFRQKPYLPSYHFAWISQSSGLRAPPAC